MSEQVQQQGKRSESERVRLLESKRMRIEETLANEGHVIVMTVSFVKTGIGRSSFCTACLSAARHASRTSTGGNQSDRRRSISLVCAPFSFPGTSSKLLSLGRYSVRIYVGGTRCLEIQVE